MISSTDTVIVGAGPYGLSTSAYLTEAGVPHQVLGLPMHAWKNFTPPGMLLRSEAFASNLYAPGGGYTVEDYCRHIHMEYKPVGLHLPVEMFVDYGQWFQSELVAHIRPVEVQDMCRKDGYFRLGLSDGSSLVARRVVLSLGLKAFGQAPSALRGVPKPYVLHSGDFGDAMWARGKEIVIVGGGQSAIGLAALMGQVGARVRLLVRGEAVNWSKEPRTSSGIMSRLLRARVGLGRGWDSNKPWLLAMSYMLSEYPASFHKLSLQHRQRILETSWGPSGAWWLRDRVEGKIEISTRTEVSHAEVRSGRVVLEVDSGNGTSAISADHVVLATGFKVDMARHAFISSEILSSLSLIDGSPDLTSNFETSVRDLYVLGPAAAMSFGPALRFIYGARCAVPRVARHIGGRFKREAGRFAAPPHAATPELANGHAGSGVHAGGVLQAVERNAE
ncbi:Ferredoxin--NADP reductase [Cupriavidus laharis]|uniref:Ferredoxin--NADP reductase n=1 Tax=Cupriavidus laharis TaxID=151654 RepID=A0ABM8WD10_9BURK|nr:NAD(P)-binding domain-containing protein [Cupriavidus laharis]CAG9165193.1 Ferredoxin--NADP reductase [Cupriavidus laharis]